MKKHIIILSLALVMPVFLLSCSKDDDKKKSNPVNPYVSVNIFITERDQDYYSQYDGYEYYYLADNYDGQPQKPLYLTASVFNATTGTQIANAAVNWSVYPDTSGTFAITPSSFTVYHPTHNSSSTTIRLYANYGGTTKNVIIKQNQNYNP